MRSRTTTAVRGQVCALGRRYVEYDPIEKPRNAIEFLKELKMNGIGQIHAKSKQGPLTLGSEARRLVSRPRASWLRLVPVMLCLFAGAIAAQGQTVTSTVNAGELPYAMGGNPVTKC